MSIPGTPTIQVPHKKGVFTRFAEKTAAWAGHPSTFLAAFSIILVWAVSGPIFGFSDTWQLVINTGTTIITFLMVFLIQNSQNRDTRAIHLKLDELIRSHNRANTAMMDLEELSEDELASIRDEYEELAKEARHELRKGKKPRYRPLITQE